MPTDLHVMIEGIEVVIEADDSLDYGDRQMSAADRAREAATDSFDKARSTIRAMTVALGDDFRTLPVHQRPAEMSVAFALKFTAGGSVKVISAEAEAQLTVSAVYRFGAAGTAATSTT